MTTSAHRADAPPHRERPLARLLWLVALGLLLLHVFISSPMLDPYSVHDDFRQNMYWAPALADPRLFANDPMASYARHFVTPGVVALYWPFIRLGISANATSKGISVFLFVVFLLGVWELGRAIDTRRRGLVPPLLLIAVLLNPVYFYGQIMGGIARGTAFPLQAWFLALLARRRLRAATALTWASAFFHPQTFILCSASLLAWLFLITLRRLRRGDWRRPCSVLVIAGVGILALSAMLMREARERERLFGRTLNYQEVMSAPEFHPGGRNYNDFPHPLPVGLLRELTQRPVLLPRSERWSRLALTLFALASGIGLLAWAWVRRRRTVLRLWPLLLPVVYALLFYETARETMARLYFPDRFIRPVIPLLLLVVLVRGLEPWLTRLRLSRRGLAGAAWAVIILVWMIKPFSPSEVDGYREGVLRDIAPVARFIRGLPIDTVIATYPRGDAENLATLAQRPVYVLRELDHALFWGHLTLCRTRIDRSLRALFPESVADIVPLADDGVDDILINKRMLGEMARGELLPGYDEPQQSWLRRRVAVLTPQAIADFWLRDHADAIIYQDDAYALFSVSALLGRRG